MCVNVRIGLVALLAAAAILTERRYRSRARFDPAGAALLVVIATICHRFFGTRSSDSILQVMRGSALIYGNA